MTDETRELTRTIDRRQRWRAWVVLAAFIVAFTALAFSASQYVANAREDRQRAQQQEGRADEAVTAVEQLCSQVEQLGRRCVVEPEELTGEPIPPTEEQLRPLVQQYVEEWLAEFPPQDGRDAPTLAELTAVIADLIADELRRNPPPAGEDGQDGETPTVEELRPIVVEAVAAHLLANPPPPGPAGQDGEPGEDGADSNVPGPAGEPGEPPLTWTFQTCDLLGNCTVHRCERDEPFDRNQPRYTCTAVED